jgi:broad specificity phosphatase PhoE
VTLIALIRHMPTAWNLAGRLQGGHDAPLLPGPDRGLPGELAGFRVLSSPLARARQTAARLGLDPEIDERLAEMAWGEWEGRSLAELRAALGQAMAANEARGLDFRPPGGESPREVQQRVRPLLAEIAESSRSAIAITHKGVIRAVFALAAEWEMRGKPPHRLDWAAAHLFRLDANGQPTIERLNLPLAA